MKFSLQARYKEKGPNSLKQQIFSCFWLVMNRHTIISLCFTRPRSNGFNEEADLFIFLSRCLQIVSVSLPVEIKHLAAGLFPVVPLSNNNLSVCARERLRMNKHINKYIYHPIQCLSFPETWQMVIYTSKHWEVLYLESWHVHGFLKCFWAKTLESWLWFIVSHHNNKT